MRPLSPALRAGRARERVDVTPDSQKLIGMDPIAKATNSKSAQPEAHEPATATVSGSIPALPLTRRSGALAENV